MALKIFVTLGTKDYPFDRIVKALDEKNVFMQIGNSGVPKKASFQRFMTKQEIYDKMDWADVIVCHAGTGTLMEAIDLNKKMIVVPRQKKFGEHIDDHQVMFSKYIQKEFDLEIVFDVKNIWWAIKNSCVPKISPADTRLVKEVKRIVNE